MKNQRKNALLNCLAFLFSIVSILILSISCDFIVTDGGKTTVDTKKPQILHQRFIPQLI